MQLSFFRRELLPHVEDFSLTRCLDLRDSLGHQASSKFFGMLNLLFLFLEQRFCDGFDVVDLSFLFLEQRFRDGLDAVDLSLLALQSLGCFADGMCMDCFSLGHEHTRFCLVLNALGL